jgi:hypothetical protein
VLGRALSRRFSPALVPSNKKRACVVFALARVRIEPLTSLSAQRYPLSRREDERLAANRGDGLCPRGVDGKNFVEASEREDLSQGWRSDSGES